MQFYFHPKFSWGNDPICLTIEIRSQKRETLLTCTYCSTAGGSTTTKQPLIPEVYAGDPSTLSAEAATGRVQVRWGDLGFFVHRRSRKAMWLW